MTSSESSRTPNPAPTAPTPAATPAPASRVGLVAAGLLWAATMATLVATEVVGEQRGEDVQALVDAARLEGEHASARYVLRFGEAVVGELRSSVTGGQREDQLAYVLRGEIRVPRRLEIEGFVLADWQRRPERFVFEARIDGAVHRVTGGLTERAGTGGRVFTAVHHSTAGGTRRSGEWLLPQAPVLAPGPLPVPELGSLPGGERGGSVATPFGGAPVSWTIETESLDAHAVAGGTRPALRHLLTLSGVDPAGLSGVGVGAVEWITEPEGFPLRVRVGGAAAGASVELELVEESR